MRQRSRDQSFFAPALPRIFAHRGLALGAPENTLLAFLKALCAGASHLETDVHASADGIAVISHDLRLQPVGGAATNVEQLTMAQLRRVELGYGQGLVSLPEALDAFPDARFNIDIKSPRAVEPTVKAIRSANATGRVLVTSFSNVRRAQATALLPGVATSASSPQVATAIISARLGITPLVRRIAAGVDAVQLPERYRGIRLVTHRSVRMLHAAALEVHVWTVNDPADMRRLIDLGVDGIVTDRCDIARDVVAAGS